MLERQGVTGSQKRAILTNIQKWNDGVGGEWGDERKKKKRGEREKREIDKIKKKKDDIK